MAEYRVNGYGLFLGPGIIPDTDRTTANSFEKPADISDVYSYTWPDGFVEYDLSAPITKKPRLFIIKGRLIADDIATYNAGRQTIIDIFYQSYVTIEHLGIGEKVNARIRSGATSWNRVTNIDATPIIVEVQFQFDEVLQSMPFIDNGSEGITYLTDSDGRFYNTQGNKFIIT